MRRLFVILCTLTAVLAVRAQDSTHHAEVLLETTEGNIQLVLNNVRLAARIAAELEKG